LFGYQQLAVRISIFRKQKYVYSRISIFGIPDEKYILKDPDLWNSRRENFSRFSISGIPEEQKKIL
jgi:hypothetical protein